MGLKRRKKRFRGYSVPEAETLMMDNSRTGSLMKWFLLAQISFAVAYSVGINGMPKVLVSEDEGSTRSSSRQDVPAQAKRALDHGAPLQDRPVIGLVTQPLWEDVLPSDSVARDSHPPYLAASYVKLVEAAGARPAVIFHNSTDQELEQMFQSVNAILFPGGGGQPLDAKNPYMRVGKKILKLAEAANQEGDHFSLHFTCLGFELLVTAITNNATILQPTDANDLADTLTFDWREVQTSRMFETRGVINGTAYAELLANNPLAMNFHRWGVYAADFRANPMLSRSLNVLSTSRDRQGREYVSTVEARKFPFFATQWHPEKNAFEWQPSSSIPHSPDAVAVSNFFAQLLGAQARRNEHRFESEEALNRALVYNWPPVFSAAQGGRFEQMYIFV